MYVGLMPESRNCAKFYLRPKKNCASRMYQNDISEQMIKETTGEYVRLYKWTSDQIHEDASKVVSSVSSQNEVRKGKMMKRKAKKAQDEVQSWSGYKEQLKQ